MTGRNMKQMAVTAIIVTIVMCMFISWKISGNENNIYDALFNNYIRSSYNNMMGNFSRRTELHLGSSAITTEDLNTHTTEKDAVPKIVHYIWFYRTPKPIKFHHLISLLSAFQVIKPLKIILWNSVPPVGEYWEMALKRIPVIELRHREIPTVIYGNDITVPEHQSSLSRLEVLMEHGGIYLDFDVIAISPMESLLQYDVTLGRESSNALCNGVIVAKKNATFLNIWHRTYVTYKDKNIWGEHSVLMPHRLSKKYPELLHVEEDSMQRPNWQKQEIKYIYNPKYTFNWRKKYTLHLWYRFYNKQHNPNDIKTLNSTLGYVFRYIYYGNASIING